jgi:hypothetical protein
MAVIKSGVDATLLTVDPTSKAARVTQYDSTARELYPKPTGSYITKIETRCTGAPAAGQTIWNMRGPPTLKAYIRNIRGTICFDGTALAASGTLRLGLYRGTSAAVSPTGGTANTISKKDSTMGASTVADCRFDLTGAGLTTTGITYEADAFHVISLPVISLQVAAPATSASAGAVAVFDLDFHTSGEPSSDVVIAASEHLAIRIQTVAGIIGFGIGGSVSWDER